LVLVLLIATTGDSNDPLLSLLGCCHPRPPKGLDIDKDNPVRSQMEDPCGDNKKRMARTGMATSAEIFAMPSSVSGLDHVPTLEKQMYKFSCREMDNIHPICNIIHDVSYSEGVADLYQNNIFEELKHLAEGNHECLGGHEQVPLGDEHVFLVGSACRDGRRNDGYRIDEKSSRIDEIGNRFPTRIWSGNCCGIVVVVTVAVVIAWRFIAVVLFRYRLFVLDRNHETEEQVNFGPSTGSVVVGRGRVVITAFPWKRP